MSVLFFHDIDPKEPWWVIALVLLFPAAGLGLLGYLVFLWLRWRKFGESTFRMAHVPGVIGGQLAGVVIVPQIAQGDDGFRVALTCTQEIQMGEDTEINLLWDDERIIDQTLSDEDPTRVGVPILLTIPSDAQATNEDESIKWTLQIKSKNPGIHYDAEFEVPVFETEDSQTDVTVDAKPLTPFERDTPLNQLLAEEKILVESLATAEGIRYVSPLGRNRRIAITWFLFTFLWTAMIVSICGQAGQWIPVVIFAIFAIPFWFVTLDNALGCSELTIEGNRWRVRSGWYGLRRKTREFTSAEITSIVPNRAMSVAKKQWNDLMIHLNDGSKLKAVRRLSNRRAERKLLAELRQRAGIEEPLEEEGPSSWDELDDLPST